LRPQVDAGGVAGDPRRTVEIRFEVRAQPLDPAAREIEQIDLEQGAVVRGAVIGAAVDERDRLAVGRP
jgi:hypothetical protein